MSILKTGVLAYLDTFAGLVPVKVVSVRAPEPTKGMGFDLVSGEARASIRVGFKVTADHGGYKKGEQLEDNSLNVVPQESIQKSAYSSYITPYGVECDPKPDPSATARLHRKP